MKIVEVFDSIQGEGKHIGKQATFIRLAGCNLNCSWCDTDFKARDEVNIGKMVSIVNSSPNEIIVWTGGEPMLQYTEMSQVIQQTPSKQHHLETNATIWHPDLGLLFAHISFSPKLDSAGNSAHNPFISKFMELPNAECKLVIKTKEDLYRAMLIVKMFSKNWIYFTPEGGKKLGVLKGFKLPNNIILLPQLHKIWKLR